LLKPDHVHVPAKQQLQILVAKKIKTTNPSHKQIGGGRQAAEATETCQGENFRIDETRNIAKLQVKYLIMLSKSSTQRWNLEAERPL